MGVKSFFKNLVEKRRELGEMRVSEYTASATSEAGDRSVAGDLWHKIGSRHLEKKRFTKAEKAFKKAIENYERVGGTLKDSAQNRAGKTSMALGDCYKKMGKLEKAVEAYEKAKHHISEAKYAQWELDYQEALKRTDKVLNILAQLELSKKKK